MTGERGELPAHLTECPACGWFWEPAPLADRRALLSSICPACLAAMIAALARAVAEKSDEGASE